MAEFRLSNFTSGGVLTAAELNTGLTYATYTPVWMQSTKTITNTLNFARFTQFGKYVSGTVKLTSTTSGTPAANTHQVTLPVEANTNNDVLGSAWCADTAAPVQYPLVCVLLNATNVQFIRTDSTVAQPFRVNSNVDFFVLRFNFTYEAA
jgi:hypothetical protein